MKNHLARLTAALSLGLPLLATAQAIRPDPSDAKAAAPPLRYNSSFADYKPWRDTKPGDWRALNDALQGTGAGGGHAGHATPPAPAPLAPHTAPHAAPHAAPRAAPHAAHQAPPQAASAPAGKASAAPHHHHHHRHGSKP